MRESWLRSCLLGSLAVVFVGCGGTVADGEGPRRAGEGDGTQVALGATVTDATVGSESDSTSSPADPEPAIPSGPRVFAFDGYAKIYLKPHDDSAPIGLIRAGESVPLKDVEPLTGWGVGHCKGSWYAVKPRGYVCTGRHATLDGRDARVRAAAEVLPKPDAPMPFKVGIMLADAPQYRRVPTKAEQAKHEPGLDEHLAKLEAGSIPVTVGSATLDKRPAGRGPSDAFVRYEREAKPALLADAKAYEGRKMAFVSELDAEGRTFLVTPDLTLVPKDKVRFVAASKLRGVDLKKGEMKFPFGFTWIQDTAKLKKQQDGAFKETGDVYPKGTFVQLEGGLERGKGGNYWKTADGTYVRNELVSIFKQRPERPKNIGKNDKWIDVRVTWGTLVAYEGETPVYATAISPGQDGITPGRNSHNTLLGQHQVGWKLVSANMSGVEKRKPWAVDEVPFVAYYKDSYAVHGAWWHDDFGRPKSHGCVNVAPNDAHVLWHWMDPQMPEGWYAVAAFHPEVKGTTVLLRP